MPYTADDIVRLTNQYRHEQHRPELVLNEKLNRAAQRIAEDMAARGYFIKTHVSPEGKTPWHFLEEAGYTAKDAGQNLALTFNDSPDSVIGGWKNSPAHNAAMLNKKYKEVGVAVVPGVYKGNKGYFTVQMFGVPTPRQIFLEKRPQPRSSFMDKPYKPPRFRLLEKEPPQKIEVKHAVSTPYSRFSDEINPDYLYLR